MYSNGSPTTLTHTNLSTVSTSFHDCAFFTLSSEQEYRLNAMFADLGDFIDSANTADDKPLVEGNIGQLQAQMAAYTHLAENRRRVCEVGFNAGHSAIVFLLANTAIEYVGFTLDLPAARRGLEFIMTHFPHRNVTILFGDSVTTVVGSLARLSQACDVIVV